MQDLCPLVCMQIPVVGPRSLDDLWVFNFAEESELAGPFVSQLRHAVSRTPDAHAIPCAPSAAGGLQRQEQ